MATYEELYGLQSNDDLLHRVAVATIIAAETLLAGTPTAQQAQWATSIIEQDILVTARRILYLVLAANNAATVAQITGATDAQIQTNVDNVVAGLVAAI